ncbi:MAG: CNNM domain-containing protein [Bacteroides sp.]|nr:CNNM domain-containing protein [Bacteroides sp.]
MVLLIIYMLGTLGVSFLCSLLESVLMSTPISFVTMKKEQGYKPADKFYKFKSDPDRPLAAILSLNTIANTLGAAAIGRQATILFGSAWFGIISAATTLLVLVFSEIVPKTIGTSCWKSLMGFVTSVISFLTVLMWPLVIIVQLITRLLSRDDDEATVSRDEVTAMANIGLEEGVIDSDENKVIQNIMKLDNVKACDVMTPRIVAMTAQENMTLKNFYKNDTYLHFSRIPVYADSPEYITGYILLSDALEGLADDEFDKRLVELKRPISFFKEEDSCGFIWEELLKKHEQMALIIDEYGCFQGIITLEDIIETILGLEIIDENDQATDMQQFARERWERRQKRFRTIVLPKEDPKEDLKDDH